MEREKADLEVEMPDGTVARVVAQHEDHWVVVTAYGEEKKITPPAAAVRPERAEHHRLPKRELGS